MISAYLFQPEVSWEPVGRKGRGSRLTPEAMIKGLQALELYRAGRTLQGIGDELGLTRERARQLLNHLSPVRRKRRHHLLSAGILTARQISTRLKIPVPTINSSVSGAERQRLREEGGD